LKANARYGYYACCITYPGRSGAFLKEGPYALLVVVAVVNLAAERLDTLVRLWRERVGIREDPQLLLHDPVDERRRGGDVGGKVGSRSLKLRCRNDSVQDAVGGHPPGRNATGGEQHLLHEMHVGDLHEVEHTRQVVRDPKPSRRERERRLGGCHDEVAREDQLAGSAPDRAFHHRDYRSRVGLNLADHRPERIVVCEGVAPIRWQFAHVVARREDARAPSGADHNGSNVGRPIRDERRGQLVDQDHAQGVDRRTVEGDPRDCLAHVDDDRGHNYVSPSVHSAENLPGLRTLRLLALLAFWVILTGGRAAEVTR
jgi:hypothetical protein